MSIGDYLPKREFLLSKKFFTILAFVFGASFLIWAVYLYNPKFVPETVRVANDNIVDTVLGKDLAQAIDAKRDADGAVTIRELFNTNKEQNLEKHCEKKLEQGKEQEKCYKKYVNEEFGYSFEYPVGVEIKLEPAEELANGSISVVALEKQGKQQIWIEKTTRSMNEMEEKILADLKVESTNEMNISGLKGKGYIGKVTNEEQEVKARTILVQDELKKEVYIFYYTEAISSPEDLTVEFEKLLSTFKLS